MKKRIFLLSCLLFIGCTQKPTFHQPEVVVLSPTEQISVQKNNVTKSLLINVPFSSQAPFAIWDPLHEEACEEMSLLMLHHYLEGKALTKEVAEEELQKLIQWEESNGYLPDISIEDLALVTEKYFGYDTKILADITEDVLRNSLREGNPVIIPAAGRLLKNPFFSGEGPYYHMLVVTGFTDDGFVTNDPGTKRGKQYFYPTKTFMNAIHNWTGVKEEIEQGRKVGLVVVKR